MRIIKKKESSYLQKLIEGKSTNIRVNDQTQLEIKKMNESQTVFCNPAMANSHRHVRKSPHRQQPASGTKPGLCFELLTNNFLTNA